MFEKKPFFNQIDPLHSSLKKLKPGGILCPICRINPAQVFICPTCGRRTIFPCPNCARSIIKCPYCFPNS